MPLRASALGESLSDWFRLERIAPAIVAEIQSPDLMSVVADSNSAVFAVPTTIASDVERGFRVAAIGEAPTVEQHFYMVCAEPSARSNSVLAIIERARAQFRTVAPPAAGVAGESWHVLRASADTAPHRHGANGQTASLDAQ
jgi:hypothetical protein